MPTAFKRCVKCGQPIFYSNPGKPSPKGGWEHIKKCSPPTGKGSALKLR